MHDGKSQSSEPRPMAVTSSRRCPRQSTSAPPERPRPLFATPGGVERTPGRSPRSDTPRPVGRGSPRPASPRALRARRPVSSPPTRAPIAFPPELPRFGTHWNVQNIRGYGSSGRLHMRCQRYRLCARGRYTPRGWNTGVSSTGEGEERFGVMIGTHPAPLARRIDVPALWTHFLDGAFSAPPTRARSSRIMRADRSASIEASLGHAVPEHSPFHTRSFHHFLSRRLHFPYNPPAPILFSFFPSRPPFPLLPPPSPSLVPLIHPFLSFRSKTTDTITSPKLVERNSSAPVPAFHTRTVPS